MFFNPLASEPHVTARFESTSLLPLVTSSVLVVKDNVACLLGQSEEIFQIIPEWAQFSQGHRRKRQKKCNIDLKISMKIWFHDYLLFHLILRSWKLSKKISHHNEAYLKPSKRKNMRQEKRKKKGGEKAKRKSQDCCALLNTKTKFCFLRMPKLRKLYNILHLEKKAAKCTTCKWLYGKFSSL